MVKLGFSLYPDNHNVETIISYIDQFDTANFKRVFMSLLQVDLQNQELMNKYITITKYCQEKALQVILDVTPHIIQELNEKGYLVDTMTQWGVGGIRLDESISIDEIVALTNNTVDFKVELNMSTDASLLFDLEAAGADMANVIGCHNFYPHAFTGLSRKHFMKMSQIYKEKGIETAAFVNAQTASEGPWPVSEGLCTLEEHRHLPIENQTKMLVAAKNTDNIIIANQFIEPAELTRFVQMDREVASFEVEPLVELTANERQIIDYPHTYRGDVSAYVLRSTMTRVAFKEFSIEPRNTKQEVQRGMVLIDNDRYGRYKGELHIALRDFSVSDKVNIVGKITESDVQHLDLLQPWQRFHLHIKNE